MKKWTDKDIDKKIRTHLHALQKSGVLSVRPGYEIAGHQLTGRRAIVTTVHTKQPKSVLSDSEILPDQLGGLPVDVREASAFQRLRALDPLAAYVSEDHARPEEREPIWPLERELPGGQRLDSPRSTVEKDLKAQKVIRPHAAAALTGKHPTNQLPYAPHGCPPLTLQSLKADVTLAASPDCGYQTLTGFLDGTKHSLVIGMYDFTSGPLLQYFKTVLSSPKTLQMVLDSPSLNPTADQSDWQTVQALDSSLGKRADIVRALTRGDHFATNWLFPYAYHIKVIVRDGNSLWLSSGNLNNSNEPAPSHPPTTEDRDWHIVVNSPELSAIFGAYLNYDYQVAHAHQAPNPEAIERAIEEARAKRRHEANPTGTRTYGSKKAPTPPKVTAKRFAAKDLPALAFEITPVLTPDKLPNGSGQYLTQIEQLIRAATQSICIELQYIEASQDATSDYGTLLKAIADKIAAGVPVQLIVSAGYAEKWGEKMMSAGVDLTANIHTLPNVHNKGFIIDNEFVIISSQNFSPAGITDNRDAGVIIRSQDVVSYFSPIFDYDWQRSVPLRVRASPKKKGAKRK
jgi:hypothetical protein